MSKYKIGWEYCGRMEYEEVDADNEAQAFEFAADNWHSHNDIKVSVELIREGEEDE